jgi:general secretion pathway protein J
MTAKRQTGFTLLEMLLATGLLALIMGMAYAGLQASIRLTDSGEAQIDRSARARIAHEFLRKQLSRMLPLMIRQDAGRNILFEGDTDKMTWVGPMPGYLGRGGPYVQQLSLERETDGTVLYFRFAMLNGYKDGDLEVDEPIALIEQIKDAKFAFQSIDTSGKVRDWTSRWENTDAQSLPLSVKMTLEMRPESRMNVPDLVVAVVVDGNLQRTPPSALQGITR